LAELKENQEAGILTHCLRVALLCRTGGAHGVGFARARLTIGQYGDIVALHKGSDAFVKIVPDTLLLNVLTKDVVEDKQFPALWGVHFEVCWGCDMYH
jgi:hypothetical protein